MEKETILEYVLGLYFHVEHGLGIDDAKKYINNPNVSERKSEFKKQLRVAILNNSVTPKLFERITSEELDTQEEVNSFLINEIWKPLYGDEPIKP